MDTKGRKLLQDNHIFKTFSDKISYLICPEHPIFQQLHDKQGMNVYQSLKENLTNITFMGRKEASVTSVIIIAKSLELKHAHELTEEQFSHLGEYKYSYISQRK